jgi:hypothetical protein
MTGMSASELRGNGNISTSTLGGNTMAFTNGSTAATGNASAANIIDILGGAGSAGTHTVTESNAAAMNAAAKDTSENTTLGQINGDGVSALASDSNGAVVVNNNSAVGTNSNTNGGLLAVNSGTGTIGTSNNNALTAVVRGSTASTNNSSSGTATVTGNGTGSITSTSNSSVSIN